MSSKSLEDSQGDGEQTQEVCFHRRQHVRPEGDEHRGNLEGSSPGLQEYKKPLKGSVV